MSRHYDNPKRLEFMPKLHTFIDAFSRQNYERCRCWCHESSFFSSPVNLNAFFQEARSFLRLRIALAVQLANREACFKVEPCFCKELLLIEGNSLIRKTQNSLVKTF